MLVYARQFWEAWSKSVESACDLPKIVTTANEFDLVRLVNLVSGVEGSKGEHLDGF